MKYNRIIIFKLTETTTIAGLSDGYKTAFAGEIGEGTPTG